MSIKLPKNERLIVISIIIGMIVIFTSLFFFTLYPKMERIPLKETELESQEKLLSALQEGTKGTYPNTLQSIVALQKMVPVKPLTQQLLLEIEKAEVVSGSFVVNMVFEDSELADNTQQTEENQDLEVEFEEENNSETTGEENIILPPEGVKKIKVTLSVESPTYFEFEEFISILESSERITVIEAIDFANEEEIIEEEQVDKPLSYEVVLSAFYMPSLTDLIDNLPKMETPEPANKKNPLSKFADYSGTRSVTSGESVQTESESQESDKEDAKNDAESNTDEVSNANDETEENGPAKSTSTTDSRTEAIKYTVKAGDTLTKIAKEYYPSDYKNGINKIKEANQMKNDNLQFGQELIIPSL